MCKLCKIQSDLKRIMDIAEKIELLNSALYDDAVTDVFNDADRAFHLFDHDCEEK